MSDPLPTIRNHHSPGSGDPPIVSDDDNVYVGYFENAHGEQWVDIHAKSRFWCCVALRRRLLEAS